MVYLYPNICSFVRMFCVCTIISTLNSSGNLWLYHWLECSLQPMWRAGRSHWVTSWRPQIWCDYIVSSNHRGPIILSHQQWTMIKRSIFFAMAGIWEDHDWWLKFRFRVGSHVASLKLVLVDKISSSRFQPSTASLFSPNVYKGSDSFAKPCWPLQELLILDV